MIEFEGRGYETVADESVLDCLLRHGVAVDSLCRSGSCQSCLLKATAGSVPAVAQVGLKPSLKQQGFFLSCVCRPTGVLSVERVDAAPTYPSRVIRVEPMSPEVSRVFLARPPGLEFRAGQFVQLVRPSDALMRPYSLASLPFDDELELHVALLPGGRMSGWLALAIGQEIFVRGPFGDCFYQEGEPERPLLLAGTGTGVSPLFGILKQAARSGHSGPIALFHGSPRISGLYLRREVASLNARLPSLSLIGSFLDGSPADSDAQERWHLVQTPLDQLIVSRYPKLDAHRVFLCGNPGLVQLLRKRSYLAGASLSRIHCDAFAAPHAG